MIVVGKTIRILTAATTKSSRPDTFLQTSTARLIYTKLRRHRHRQLILTAVASAPIIPPVQKLLLILHHAKNPAALSIALNGAVYPNFL